LILLRSLLCAIYKKKRNRKRLAGTLNERFQFIFLLMIRIQSKMENIEARDQKPLTILFLPFVCYGPINQSIAMGDILRSRGHRVVIVVNETWKEKVASLGFEICLIDLTDSTKPGFDEYWKNFIRDVIPNLRQSSITHLEPYVCPLMCRAIEEAKLYQKQLGSILNQIQPNVIIQDNPAGFPILVTNSVPFIRFVSCNPLEIPGPNVPPTFSGLPQNDRTDWDRFRAEYERLHRSIWEEFNSWAQQQGAPSLPDLEFNYESKYANIYIYPREADYIEHRPLGSKWYQIDSSVRLTDQAYELPACLRNRPDGSCLIYVSLGTIGCTVVDLLQRLIDVLRRTTHRFIISTGPLEDQLKLPDTMVGEGFIPQTKVLPLVDLVITHGGNNTVTEVLHFGKPMILLPMFWDQHDNAQRMHEMGFGIRLDTYNFKDEDLLTAVDTLLNDSALRDRMAHLGEQIRQRDGLRTAVDIIENVAFSYDLCNREKKYRLSTNLSSPSCH